MFEFTPLFGFKFILRHYGITTLTGGLFFKKKKQLPTPYGPGTIKQQSNDWSGCNDCPKNNTPHLLFWGVGCCTLGSYLDGKFLYIHQKSQKIKKQLKKLCVKRCFGKVGIGPILPETPPNRPVFTKKIWLLFRPFFPWIFN